WIGPDPSHIAVTTTTTTGKSGEASLATITKGVSVTKNGAGGLDILLSPAVKSKLEALAKEATPCAAKKAFVRSRHHKRQAPACGLADFVRKVGADEELRGSFGHPFTDQAWREVDEGYSGDDPVQDPGWEGDGGSHASGEDEGYFSDDEEGFFEGAAGAEADGTLEAVVFSSAEEAAALGAALSGDAAAANAAIWGGGTVTAGSFLAYIWAHLRDGKAIPFANQIPKESIQKVTKTKVAATTSSASSCPTGTGLPPGCSQECNPTSTTVPNAQPTGVVDCICSEGSNRGCQCLPETEDRITLSDSVFKQAVLAALDSIDAAPKESILDCPPNISKVPSKFFLEQTSIKFCAQVMGSLDSAWGPRAYDILGDEIPLLKKVMASQVSGRSLFRRTPPEKAESFLDYRFHLAYEPKEGECSVPRDDLCKNAWDKLVKSKCGSNHGSLMDRMFVDASIDVGCAKFSWQVDSLPAPLPKPSFSPRSCHADSHHRDVQDNAQLQYSQMACQYYEGAVMKAGDKELYFGPPGIMPDNHQNFKISWVEGCETSAAEQKSTFPIEGDALNCTTLMRENYQLCNNGGAGGFIDAGCLRYDFYPTSDPDGVIGKEPNESGGIIGKDPSR
ncbi:hypothetical protein BDZ85DRAFT_204310, partial [Elsinoe ampelina]